jgi:hypothetical protein
MTKLTQWEWEQAVAKEAIQKRLPQAAQWKRHQHHPTVSPRSSVLTLVPSSGVQATPAPARYSIEHLGRCTVFWLPARKHPPATKARAAVGNTCS